MSRIFFLFSIISRLEFLISSRIFTFLYRQVIFLSEFYPVNKGKVGKIGKTKLFILTMESRLYCFINNDNDFLLNKKTIPTKAWVKAVDSFCTVLCLFFNCETDVLLGPASFSIFIREDC